MVIKQISLKRENIGRTGIDMVRVWEAIRFVAVFCLAAVLLIGCGGEPNLDDPKVREKIWAEAVDFHQLDSDGDIYYVPGQPKPYTGWVKIQPGSSPGLSQFQNGKRHGIFIKWDRASQKVEEKSFFKNGALEGLLTEWHDNGKKSLEQTYKAGERHGLRTEWDETGKKVLSETYKDGKKVE